MTQMKLKVWRCILKLNRQPSSLKVVRLNDLSSADAALSQIEVFDS